VTRLVLIVVQIIASIAIVFSAWPLPVKVVVACAFVFLACCAMALAGILEHLGLTNKSWSSKSCDDQTLLEDSQQEC
jgi:heme A synthase